MSFHKNSLTIFFFLNLKKYFTLVYGIINLPSLLKKSIKLFNRTKRHNRLPDRELIDLFKSGDDMNALGILFKRYSHLVASIAIGILKNEQKAKDVVQDIFEVVAKDLKKYDVQNFNAWIYSVTKFHCFKVKKEPSNLNSDQEIESKDDFEDVLENELLLQKRVQYLKKSLNEIKPVQKKCVELFYFKGLSYKEIAEKTGYDLKEIKSHIQNGKRNLKLLIDNSGK